LLTINCNNYSFSYCCKISKYNNWW